ncbi:hypothetical protein HF673_01195 [Acidithiobacillus thiooxidans]|uniref:Replicative helicase inhibitor G39P N-terminal domain-containing protein n=2 Tax=Acidithiobacillus thiooxidans TaxID=930 RepID=A0A1C2I3Y5_ACITH|nr:hypothetical protein [Acidithiobacillus thiooxidans]MBU2834431.1 hypothetical protein [Acidithiobacillus thiooxidans]OCX70607.1 hypothetical protein A6M23_13815 [Acidithiobacillus thiooxidans]OCX82951.1 hypothetical protein A6P08_11275 [Acidithiobacillus thiooxidans]QFX96690.1 hypothetical protein GCD22_02501 [Acidithiobacillus thiooxidans ATCC 19377]
MNREDKAQFAELIGGLLETYHQPEPSARVMKNWWAALESFPFQGVEWAVSQYMRTGKFPPKPADICGMIDDALKSRWFSADEAWAHALRALDEYETVIWTHEAAKAFEIAKPLLEMNDKVGARRAFEAAYLRAVAQAAEDRRLPVFLVSEGWDHKRRLEAISRAKAEGFLTTEQADRYLSRLSSEMSDDALMIAGLVTGKVSPHPSAKTKEFADMMRRALASATEKQKQAEMVKQAERQATKDAFEAKRKAMLEKLQAQAEKLAGVQ